MSKTKIKIAEVKILSVEEKSYEGISYFEYSAECGDSFNSKKRFEVGDVVSVYLGRFNDKLTLNYSFFNE